MTNIDNPPTIIKTGSYAGDSGVNKAIPHGLGRIPLLVWLRVDGDFYVYYILGGAGNIVDIIDTSCLAVTVPDNINFYVGNATNFNKSANGGFTYDWVAI